MKLLRSWRGRWPRCEHAALQFLHAAVLLRLRLEAWQAIALARLTGRPAPPRVIATACWHFPIYSQTFVQQEAAALAGAGFELRFFHAQTGPRSELAHPCALLWRRRRRLILHRLCGAADLHYFRSRDPAGVERLLQTLGAATGLADAALLQHDHVLQAFSFARAAQAWRADYLHSYFFYEQSLFVWVAASLLGLPRGISCYADHVLDDYPLKAVRLQLAGSAVTIAASRRIGQELAALHGGPLSSLLVKPNAVDTASFAPHRRAAPRSAGLRLVSACRLDPKKGLEYLIDALALLQKQGLSVQLRILGAPDAHSMTAAAYAAALRTQVSALALDERVQILGQCDSRQIRHELGIADAFVAPFVELANGDKDGIPTALLEAMAAGCAIVATDAGSIPEIVDDGVEALIVAQRDAPALANALSRLAGTPVLVQALGEAAARRARQEFDVVTCEQPFHAAVHEAVRRSAIGLGREGRA